jgi:hypothetical protein
MGAPPLSLPAEVSARALDSAATRAFAVVAGLGGVALLVISYRKQRSTEAEDRRAELAVNRETTRLFVDRLDQASEKLGSEHAVIRLAGVHALAHLADDAPTEQLAQTVIDILCGYLRMPYSPEPPRICNAPQEVLDANRTAMTEFVGLQQVRHTILRLIKERLRVESRWRGKNFDFTGAVFDGGDFIGCHFTGGKVSFSETLFIPGSSFSFEQCHFSGATVSFRNCTFAGKSIDFTNIKSKSGNIDFGNSTFEGDQATFGGMRIFGGSISFSDTLFSGDISVFQITVKGGRLRFIDASIVDSGLLFYQCEFNAGDVEISVSEIKDSTIRFLSSHFSGSTVDFIADNESPHQVAFSETTFTGGLVNFTGESSLDPFRSNYRVGACPEGLLEALDDAPPEVFSLPEQWRKEHDLNY